jgi:hypothetical protein
VIFLIRIFVNELVIFHKMHLNIMTLKGDVVFKINGNRFIRSAVDLILFYDSYTYIYIPSNISFVMLISP